MIWGILPGKENVSWESHLFGFVSGFMVAFYFGKYNVTELEEQEAINEEFAAKNSTHDKEFDLYYEFKEED